MNISNFFKDDKGKECAFSASCILGLVGFVFLAAWAVIANHQTFSGLEYGGGLGSAIGATAAGLGIKAKLGG